MAPWRQGLVSVCAWAADLKQQYETNAALDAYLLKSPRVPGQPMEQRLHPKAAYGLRPSPSPKCLASCHHVPNSSGATSGNFAAVRETGHLVFVRWYAGTLAIAATSNTSVADLRHALFRRTGE